MQEKFWEYQILTNIIKETGKKLMIFGTWSKQKDYVSFEWQEVVTFLAWMTLDRRFNKNKNSHKIWNIWNYITNLYYWILPWLLLIDLQKNITFNAKKYIAIQLSFQLPLFHWLSLQKGLECFGFCHSKMAREIHYVMFYLPGASIKSI